MAQFIKVASTADPAPGEANCVEVAGKKIALFNLALRTVCANCGKSIPTEVGHAHPLDAEDHGVWRDTWGLVGIENGGPKVFPTCHECYQAGWRPPGCLP